MCGFEPGDEVMCVSNVTPQGNTELTVTIGQTYTVLRIEPTIYSDGRVDYSDPVVQLVEATWPCPFHRGGYDSALFRKVERRTETRDLEAWLAQPTTYDEEQRNPAPVKRREKA